MSAEFSYRRVAGLLCYALAGFMTFAFVMLAINRIFWHRSYSVVEDVIVFGVVGLIAAAAAVAGHSLRPGPYSLRTLFVGLTVVVIVMAELAFLVRAG
jgi:hypothetical protein